MSSTSKHLSIRGRVQGVGYRAWFAKTAEKQQLKGWVRNRQDGSVEAVIAGSEEAVVRMIESAKNGPFMARVESVGVADGPQQEKLNDFEVRPSA